jgi:hypothetical protein
MTKNVAYLICPKCRKVVDSYRLICYNMDMLNMQHAGNLTSITKKGN